MPRIIAQPNISISTKLLAKAGRMSMNSSSSHSAGCAWNVLIRLQLCAGAGGAARAVSAIAMLQRPSRPCGRTASTTTMMMKVSTTA